MRATKRPSYTLSNRQRPPDSSANSEPVGLGANSIHPPGRDANHKGHRDERVAVGKRISKAKGPSVPAAESTHPWLASPRRAHAFGKRARVGGAASGHPRSLHSHLSLGHLSHAMHHARDGTRMCRCIQGSPPSAMSSRHYSQCCRHGRMYRTQWMVYCRHAHFTRELGTGWHIFIQPPCHWAPGDFITSASKRALSHVSVIGSWASGVITRDRV